MPLVLSVSPGCTPALARVDSLFRDGRWLAACLAVAVFLSMPIAWPKWVDWVAAPFAVSLAAACAVGCAARPIAPGRGGLLAWAPVRHLGRISYGLYVYHYFVPEALALIVPGFASPHGAGQKLVAAVVAGAVSLALAALSWRFVERPALGARNLWPREARPAPPGSAAYADDTAPPSPCPPGYPAAASPIRLPPQG